MIPVMCIVQEGQIPGSDELGLKEDIQSFTQKVFDTAACVDWIVVPKGSGFTAAKPSKLVVLSLQANRLVGQEERAGLLRTLCDICVKRTGRKPAEVLTAVRDMN